MLPQLALPQIEALQLLVESVKHGRYRSLFFYHQELRIRVHRRLVRHHRVGSFAPVPYLKTLDSGCHQSGNEGLRVGARRGDGEFPPFIRLSRCGAGR